MRELVYAGFCHGKLQNMQGSSLKQMKFSSTYGIKYIAEFIFTDCCGYHEFKKHWGGHETVMDQDRQTWWIQNS